MVGHSQGEIAAATVSGALPAGAVAFGTASGLGAATADRLAGAGADVFAFDLAGSAWSAARESNGVERLEVDVTDPAAVRGAIAYVHDQGAPLRVVVNCAGVDKPGLVLGEHGPHDLNLFRRVVEVNLIGTFVVLTLAAEVMASPGLSSRFVGWRVKRLEGAADQRE